MINRIDIDYSSVNSLPSLLDLLRKNGVPENQFWSYMNIYQERKAREKGIPLYGQFELTPLCNLDCKMCYVHLNNDQMKGENVLSVSQWKDIIRQAHQLGMMNATLTGGECLTYPGFDELYFYLRSLGIQTSIKTNGVLLDRERVNFFNKYPPRSITVSLYGSSNEGYVNVTGYPVFDVVYNNLLLLKDSQFPITIAITPSKYMDDEIKEIIDLAKELDYRFLVNIMLFSPRSETGRVVEDLSTIEYCRIFEMLRESKTVPQMLPEETDLPDYNTQGNTAYGIRCGAGRSTFNVNWHGFISGCDNLKAKQINLLGRDFASAWEEIHKEAVSFPLPMECSGCAYDKVCPSCIAYRGNNAELGHCNKVICERTKLFVGKGIYDFY